MGGEGGGGGDGGGDDGGSGVSIRGDGGGDGGGEVFRSGGCCDCTSGGSSDCCDCTGAAVVVIELADETVPGGCSVSCGVWGVGDATSIDGGWSYAQCAYGGLPNS